MKRVYLACAMLALLTCSTTQSIAQTQSVDRAMSPVEEMKRASDETLRLQQLLWKLPLDRVDEKRKLNAQLEEARNRESAIESRIDQKIEAADRQQAPEESKRLREYLEAVRQQNSDHRFETERLSKCAPLDVVISEVCYLPKQGECEWVELANVTDNPVNIGGWVLRDGQTLTFELPCKLSPVPPKGFVLVLFDGTDASPSDFDKSGKAVVHTPQKLKGDVLGDESGHLALYGPNKRLYGAGPRYATVVHGYVAWGAASPGKIAQDAVEAKRWGSIDDFLPGSDGGIALGGCIKVMTQGGSLRLFSGQAENEAVPKWLVVEPEAVTPGAAGEKPIPRLGVDRQLPLHEDGTFIMMCSQLFVPDVRYHFQICQDGECNKVLLETTIGENCWFAKYPVLASEEVHVRVRTMFPDGTVSKWSAIKAIVGRIDSQQEK